MHSEQDAQMCIYHISWQNKFGFCCELDEDTARDLAGNDQLPLFVLLGHVLNNLKFDCLVQGCRGSYRFNWMPTVNQKTKTTEVGPLCLCFPLQTCWF